MGLVAGAAEIEIGDPVGAEDAEGVIALGRQIDPPVGRRGGDKEHRLFCDEGYMIIVQRIKKFRHVSPFSVNCSAQQPLPDRQPRPPLDTDKGQYYGQDEPSKQK